LRHEYPENFLEPIQTFLHHGRREIVDEVDEGNAYSKEVVALATFGMRRASAKWRGHVNG
jgi:hypothetical protein